MTSATLYSSLGIEIVGNADTDRFKVDIGTIASGGGTFTVHLLLSQRAPKHAIPSCAKVQFGEKVIWFYDPKRHGEWFARLVREGDTVALAFVGKESGRVERVFPFDLLARGLDPDLHRSIALKRAAAKFYGLDFWLSNAEQAFEVADPAARQRREDEKRAAEAKAKAAEDAKRRKREEREALQLALKGRERVHVLGIDGKTYHGIPVTESEWRALPKGAFGVLVEGFDEDGRPYGPIEVFKAGLIRRGTKKPFFGKVISHAVADFASAKEKLERPTSTGVVVVEIAEDRVYEVAVYASGEDLATLEKIGHDDRDHLEFVAHPAGGGTYMVYALNTKGGTTELQRVGERKPIVAAKSAA